MLFLGIADLIAALLLVRGFYSVPVPNVVIFIFAFYLLLKALLFIADIGSWMDIAAGVLLILSIPLHIPLFIMLAFAILVGLKGVMSIFAGARF